MDTKYTVILDLIDARYREAAAEKRRHENPVMSMYYEGQKVALNDLRFFIKELSAI